MSKYKSKKEQVRDFLQRTFLESSIKELNLNKLVAHIHINYMVSRSGVLELLNSFQEIGLIKYDENTNIINVL